MAQAVVARLAARGLQAQGAKGKRQIVHDDEHVFQGDVLLFHPVAHGVAGEVHIRGGLEQNKPLVLQAHFGHSPVAAVFKKDIGRLGQGVQYSETYVVARVGIFGSDVAQAYNKECHHERFVGGFAFVAKDTPQAL